MKRLTLLFLLLAALTACTDPYAVATFVVEIPVQPGLETLPPEGENGGSVDPTTPEPANTLGSIDLSVTDLAAGSTVPAPQSTLTLTPTVTETPSETPSPSASPTLTQAPTQSGPPTATQPVSSTQPRVVANTADGITEIMIENRSHVVALAFLPDGRLLFTEKDGRVMLRDQGGNLYTVLSLPTERDNECGMIGIAVDPNFGSNQHLWVFHNVTGQPHRMEVKRFTLSGTSGTDVQTAASWTRLGGVCGHNGGNLHFGPDGLLYISIGDNEEPANSQNLNVIPGKIHRFQPTVPLSSPPSGPVPNSSIYAWGLRNSFDFDWDPVGGNLWATENGTYCDDQINLIEAGGNYGWRPDANNACEISRGVGDDYPYVRPIVNWDVSQAPTALMFYTDTQLRFRNELIFCTFTNKWMQRFQLNEFRTNFNSWSRVDIGNAQCESDAAQAPDGSLWFASPSTIYRLRAP